MIQSERERFAELCEKEAKEAAQRNIYTDGIGTYGEKRLHRIIKEFVCDSAENTEVPVGKYIADALEHGNITEIQTGSLYPLIKKIKYYLEQTDHHITVVYPILMEKQLYRIDPESGELLYKRCSPKRERTEDALAELFWLSELLPSSRITIRVLGIQADEYRYSERERYRKTGAYDGELFPRRLLEDRVFRNVSDYKIFLPPEKGSFTAAEYGIFIRLKGKALYSALNLLCDIGLLTRKKEEKKYRYFCN